MASGKLASESFDQVLAGALRTVWIRLVLLVLVGDSPLVRLLDGLIGLLLQQIILIGELVVVSVISCLEHAESFALNVFEQLLKPSNYHLWGFFRVNLLRR